MSKSLFHRALATHVCPDCGKPLIAGPRGGAAQNFYCSNREVCSEGYNLTYWQGQLVMAQRIGPVDDERFALYTRKQA
jgi:hypothetical protein